MAQRREHLKLSQAQLAALCKPPTTQQTISKVENNEIVPKLETMESVSRALGTTVEELFPWGSRPKPDQLRERREAKRQREAS